MNFLIALGLMIIGFAAVALWYYFKNSTWNGYANIQKLFVALCLMALVCILLIYVDGSAGWLKTLTGLDIDVDKSPMGFVTFGTGLSLYLSTKKTATSTDIATDNGTP